MKLYTLPYCPKCELAKMRLIGANINYILCTSEEEAQKNGIQAVPFLIDEETGNRYDFKQILQLCEERMNKS